MRFLMCRPDYYGVEYEINPWMNIKLKANHEEAMLQWEKLYQTMIDIGATVDLVTPVSGWPDMTFTANAGLIYQNKLILSHFKYKERQGEEAYFRSWFEQAHFTVLNYPCSPYFFEGAGDALLAGDKLFTGYGFRSDKAFYDHADYFNHDNVVYCELVDPYFYHIDTCFCPLNEHVALWYPHAFSQDSQERMLDHIQLLTVEKDEAKRFACNAIIIDQHIIIIQRVLKH